MSVIHTEVMFEDTLTVDELWVAYSCFEEQRDVCLRDLQGCKGGKQSHSDQLDELTELVDTLAASIIAGVLMECYKQDANLDIRAAAPSFDKWLPKLIAKCGDIFNCDAYPKLRDTYNCFGRVRMLYLIPLVNESLRLNDFGVQFGDTYLEVVPFAQG